MDFFPLYLSTKQQRVLIVGGGEVAYKKLKKLHSFGVEVALISPEYSNLCLCYMHKHAISYQTRPYEKGDIVGYSLVVLATNSPSLHHAIYEESRQERVLVNATDSLVQSDVIFPSVVVREGLSVAFSTQGASPALSKALASYFETKIPHNIGAFIAHLGTLRATLPQGKSRMALFRRLVRVYMRKHFFEK